MERDANGDIIENIHMAYRVIKNADRLKMQMRLTKPPIRKDFSPNLQQINSQKKKKKKIVKKEETEEAETTKKENVPKPDQYIYSHAVKKTKSKTNITTKKTAKKAKTKQNEAQLEVANRFNDFVVEQKCEEVRNKYLIHRVLTQWLKRTINRINEKQQKALRMSSPKMVVDNKRDTIMQDEKSLLVKQEMPIDIQLKLSESIENSTEKIKSIVKSVPNFDIDVSARSVKSVSAVNNGTKQVHFKRPTKKGQNSAVSQSSTRSLRRRRRNSLPENDNIAPPPEKENPEEDSDSSKLYDYEDPVLDDSEQDLLEDADDLLSKIRATQVTKSETTTTQNMEQNNVKVVQNQQSQVKQETVQIFPNSDKNDMKGNTKEKQKKLIPLTVDDPNYLKYTNKLLEQYEREDDERELPKYVRISKPRHIPNDSSISSSISEDAAGSLTEMHLTDMGLDDRTGVIQNMNMTERIESIINFANETNKEKQKNMTTNKNEKDKVVIDGLLDENSSSSDTNQLQEIISPKRNKQYKEIQEKTYSYNTQTSNNQNYQRQTVKTEKTVFQQQSSSKEQKKLTSMQKYIPPPPPKPKPSSNSPSPTPKSPTKQIKANEPTKRSSPKKQAAKSSNSSINNQFSSQHRAFSSNSSVNQQIKNNKKTVVYSSTSQTKSSKAQKQKESPKKKINSSKTLTSLKLEKVKPIPDKSSLSVSSQKASPKRSQTSSPKKSPKKQQSPISSPKRASKSTSLTKAKKSPTSAKSQQSKYEVEHIQEKQIRSSSASTQPRISSLQINSERGNESMQTSFADSSLLNHSSIEQMHESSGALYHSSGSAKSNHSRVKVGSDLLAEADALLEEEDDSDIFELPPRGIRFGKSMEILPFDHKMPLRDLKHKFDEPKQEEEHKSDDIELDDYDMEKNQQHMSNQKLLKILEQGEGDEDSIDVDKLLADLENDDRLYRKTKEQRDTEMVLKQSQMESKSYQNNESNQKITNNDTSSSSSLQFLGNNSQYESKNSSHKSSTSSKNNENVTKQVYTQYTVEKRTTKNDLEKQLEKIKSLRHSNDDSLNKSYSYEYEELNMPDAA